jgi:hypothetical protein
MTKPATTPAQDDAQISEPQAEPSAKVEPPSALAPTVVTPADSPAAPVASASRSPSDVTAARKEGSERFTAALLKMAVAHASQMYRLSEGLEEVTASPGPVTAAKETPPVVDPSAATHATAWKTVVASITTECRGTNYFLTRDEEREVSDRAGWSNGDDRLRGYDMVDGAEDEARGGRERALEVLAAMTLGQSELPADAVLRAMETIRALPEASHGYARKGVGLVVRALGSVGAPSR